MENLKPTISNAYCKISANYANQLNLNRYVDETNLSCFLMAKNPFQEDALIVFVSSAKWESRTWFNLSDA